MHRRWSPLSRPGPTRHPDSGDGNSPHAGSARHCNRSRKALSANRIGRENQQTADQRRRAAHLVGLRRLNQERHVDSRHTRWRPATISGHAASASQCPPVLGYQRRNADARPSSTNRCNPPSSLSGNAERPGSFSCPDRIAAKTPPSSTSAATRGSMAAYIEEPKPAQACPCSSSDRSRRLTELSIPVRRGPRRRRPRAPLATRQFRLPASARRRSMRHRASSMRRSEAADRWS